MPDASSLTPSRLQTIVNALLDRHPSGEPWLATLWQQAASTRAGGASKRPTSFGEFPPGEVPIVHDARQGTVFERALAPPASFLRWLLEHPDEMTADERDTFNARDEQVRAWRRRLFSSDVTEVSAAKSEGLRQLSSRLAQRGRHKWWLFEGFARVDACLVTEHAVLILERWRDELLASSSRWYPDRVQLWRDVEAAREFAGHRKFGLLLVVDDDAQGAAALSGAHAAREASYPHLGFEEQDKLERHLLGYVTWTTLESTAGGATG